MKPAHFLPLFLFSSFCATGQITIENINPNFDNTNITLTPLTQSVSGKALCISASTDGDHVYLGGHSGVWMSYDGGLNWQHSERPQPGAGTCSSVSGNLPVPNVYDILASKANKNLVLAATGKDINIASQSGIYRSADGAKTWTLTHQFVQTPGPNAQIRNAACLTAAPDEPNTIFAAGGPFVAKSTDGGLTWTETVPESNGSVTHVAAGPQQGATKRVYAVGSRVWYSQDGGQTWQRDQSPDAPTLSFPTDAAGVSSKALAIHPGNSRIIYVSRNEDITVNGEVISNRLVVWKGDFTNFNATGSASWVKLPTVPTGYAGTTASGGNYVWAHQAPDGRFYLIASDRRTVHIAVGEPDSEDDWKRIDGGNAHVDPHGIALTANFQYFDSNPVPASFGHIFMVNDGGVVVSTNGAKTFIRGKGLSTLGLVNAAVLPNPKGKPAICMGMGDNSGYFSSNGGETWKTQDYIGGDNDVTYSDPRQPSRLFVFAPRNAGNRRDLFSYFKNGGIPNGAVGTGDRKTILGPPPNPDQDGASWNLVSSFSGLGYRPLVLTLDGEEPRPGGDFITIRQTPEFAKLLRTTAIDQITSHEDWVTAATTENAGTKVFQQGPDLPNNQVNIVQASGGHTAPVFFVSDADNARRLWKWTAGMAAWQQIVPAAGGGVAPTMSRRFFVDPYRPNILYVFDGAHVYRSDNGGGSWVIDINLEQALTNNGAMKMDVSADPNPGPVLLSDMVFDPSPPGLRFATGPAGVFYSENGAQWKPLVLTCALPMRPRNLCYDKYTNPCIRALYVSTSNFGLLKITGIPPDMPQPFGSLLAVEGKINFLRVNDVGTQYGPPDDRIDAEVIIHLKNQPGKAYGFQLRKDSNGTDHKGMLDVLRDCFNRDKTVRIDYTRTGCENGVILRAVRVD